MKNVRICILAGFGINADKELALAFELAGAKADLVHVEDLRMGLTTLDAYHGLAFPGGFSFGDHLGSGKVLSHIIRTSLRPQIEALHNRGGLIIGICNGFQTLVKMGLLPDSEGNWTQEVSLMHNSEGQFIDRWVQLSANRSNTSPWLKGIAEMTVPIRHGEGQLIVRDSGIADLLESKNLVAFSYTAGAPNGSYRDIAGITNISGRILGMMPHPECVLYEGQRPTGGDRGKTPEGMALFHNAVGYLQQIL